LNSVALPEITRKASLAGMAFLFAFSAWTAMAQTPGAPTMDMRLESVTLASSAPEWRDGAPLDAALLVTVGNPGQLAVAYRIDMTWLANGEPVPLNGAETASFDVSRQPLEAGGHRTHTIPWKLQPGQVGPGQVVATVTLRDGLDRDSRDNQAHLLVPIAVRSLSFALEGADVDISPSGTGFVRLAVHNGGNVHESIPVGLATPPIDVRFKTLLWPTVVEVPAGTTAAAAFLVRFVPDGDFTPINQSFRLRVDRPFGADLDLETPEFRSTDTAGTAGFASSFERIQEVPASLRPGVASDVGLSLSNTGTRQDNYTFLIEAPPGWHAEPVPALAALFPNEQSFVALRVTPPATALEGEQAVLRMTSRGSLDPVTHTVPIEVRLGGPSPQASPLSIPNTPYRGSSFEAETSLANLGDRALANSTATLEWRMGSVVRQATTEVPSLPPGSDWPLKIRLPAPESGGPVELRLLWPGNTLAAAATSFVHAPALALETPAALAGQPGETVAYQGPGTVFRIRNDGNAPETVHLAVSTTTGSAELGAPSSFLLPVGQTRAIPVLQRLPQPSGTTTASQLTLRASIGTLATAWNATVSTKIDDPLPPVLSPATLPAIWPQGQVLPLSVHIEEHGAVSNAKAVVTPAGLPPKSIPLLDAGGHWNATVAFEVAGTHAIHYEATDASGNKAVTKDQVVQAADVPAPRLEFSLSPGEAVNPGTMFTLTVRDALPVLHALVSLHQNGTSIERLVQVNNDTASMPFREFGSLLPGPIVLRVEATNAAGVSSSAELALDMAAPASGTLAPAPATGAPGHEAPPASALIALLALLAIAASRRWHS
jgi:hypothetical protein